MGKLMAALTYPGCTVEETAAIIKGERKKSYVNMILDETKTSGIRLKPKFEFCGDYGEVMEEGG